MKPYSAATDGTFTVQGKQQNWIWIMSCTTTYFCLFTSNEQIRPDVNTVCATKGLKLWIRFTTQPNLSICRQVFVEVMRLAPLTESSDISKQRNRWKKSPQIHFVGGNLDHCTLAGSHSVHLSQHTFFLDAKIITRAPLIGLYKHPKYFPWLWPAP